MAKVRGDRTTEFPEDWEKVVERKLQHILQPDRQRGTDERRTMDEVFDTRTLMALYKLMTGGYFDTLDYPVSTGKEANVFHATTTQDESVAVKIFRTNTATFRSFMTYIHGDPRFERVRPNRRDVVYAWATKEYKNLQRYTEAGVRVPLPLGHHENVLVMEFVGDEGTPAPRVKDLPPEDPEKAYQVLVEAYRVGLGDAALVHGDLSEYNILNYGGEMVVIDVAQSVLRVHPMTRELLERDATNLTRFFRRLGVEEATVASFLAAIEPPRDDTVSDEEE